MTGYFSKRAVGLPELATILGVVVAVMVVLALLSSTTGALRIVLVGVWILVVAAAGRLVARWRRQGKQSS